jgi:hypothetical protein
LEWPGTCGSRQAATPRHAQSVHALEKDTPTWVATGNENPRPFTLIRTADQIFERRNQYLLQRIPGAGH